MLGRYADEERGDGELEEAGSREGFRKVIYIPWTPTVQSK